MRVIHNKCRLLPLLPALIILCSAVQGSDRSDFSESFVLPGIYLNNSVRKPYRKYDNFQQREFLDESSLNTYGLLIGKRERLTSSFRYQLSGSYEFGNAAGDTTHNVLLTDNTYRTLVSFKRFSFVSIIPELHYVMEPNHRGNLFLTGGLGLHYMILNEFETDIDKEIDISDPGHVSENRFSLSYNLGLGFETQLSGNSGIAFIYGLRLWKPVQYIQTGDLFPMGADYSENFLTHSFQVSLLFPALL
ncbi:hypothetical protein CHISP_2827 [Chitinispirillum alkaliphilum]|nr:hypothetical protein CHISP_2827 [Chitinispirillum alkaliphilum]